MIPDPDPSRETSVATRDLGGTCRTKVYPPNVKGWAVIVGISRYAHEAWNLEYADRDAQQLADLVSAPAGGRFEKVQLLINEKATYQALNKALKSFLKQPDREDIVLLYFACHGTPDPDRPENIYLLTHDSDPHDISGTALPMREIDLALRETLRAERVIILADTCHSGGMALGIGRRAIDQSAVVNKYLKDLSLARGGVALLTSAATNETSREGKQWGEGHGVFTHFLLEGMRGQADGYGGQPRDGKVGARELFEYVRDMVKKATGDGQHPTIGSDAFDPALPMAICGEVDAQEHYRLAAGLEQLAAHLNEPMRYRAAAEHYAEAIQFAGKTERLFAKAELGLGRSLIRAGELDEGTRCLTRLIEREKGNAPAHAYLWLGVAQAKCRLREDAAETLKRFVQREPRDEMAPWATKYVAWLASKQPSKRFALLIGINQYSSTIVPPLKGCANDVCLMREILTKMFGVEGVNITTLLDAEATRQRILDAFAEMVGKTTPADQVMVFYSGHSVPESWPDAFGLPARKDVYLVVHDTADHGGYLDNGVSPEELHGGLTAIAAQHKMLVLDTHPSSRFIELAENHGDYTVLLASDSAQITVEGEVEINGARQTTGLFTAAMVTQLTSAPPESVSFGVLVAQAIAYMRDLEQKQTPLLIGDPTHPFFAEKDLFLHGFELAQRRSYPELSPRTVAWHYSRFSQQFDFAFPELFYSLGLALHEKGLYQQASAALTTALAQKQGRYPEALLALAQAHIGTGAYDDLLQTVTKLSDYVAEGQTLRAVTARQCAERLGTGQRYALVVGVSEYFAPAVPQATGAVDDAVMMQKLLVEQLGFAPADVTLLLDGEATREVILTELNRLAKKAVHEPGLFFFAGNGSYRKYHKSSGVEVVGITPSLLSADSRSNGVLDLSFVELTEICRDSANLVVLLDAWRVGPSRSSRMVQMEVITSVTRGLLGDIMTRAFSLRATIGGLTICPKRHTASTTPDLGHTDTTPPMEKSQRAAGPKNAGVDGNLTRAFIGGLGACPTLT